MKKLLLLFVSSILLLSGCQGLSANAVTNPYEIKIGSKILSLYDDTKETFEDNGFEVLELLDDYFELENNNIVYRDYTENNEVCHISICDTGITTYKSISVGDDVKKLEQAFSKLHGEDDHGFPGEYIVFFNSKGEEVNSSKDWDENERGSSIHYLTDDDSKITRIYITDVKYFQMGI